MSALMDQVAVLIARQRAQQTDADRQALAAAYKHQPEPFEAEFAQLACDHPEACTCDQAADGISGGTR